MLRRSLLKALIAAPAIGAIPVAASAAAHDYPAEAFSVPEEEAISIRGASGKYMEITNSDIRVFDTDGTCRVRMGVWQ